MVRMITPYGNTCDSSTFSVSHVFMITNMRPCDEWNANDARQLQQLIGHVMIAIVNVRSHHHRSRTSMGAIHDINSGWWEHSCTLLRNQNRIDIRLTTNPFHHG